MKKISIFVLFVFLVLAFAGFSQAGTWEYDFSKVKGKEWQKDWEVIAGEFDVAGGALTQSSASADDNNAFRCLALTKWEVQDGVVEAKMKHTGAGLNDALVFYRMYDTDNGYASRLQLDDYITIGKISAGRHGHIKYVSTPVDADTWYVVKVELEGSTITVSVDDQEKVTVDDTWSSKGRVGFGMSRCAGGASIEWLRVTGDGITPTAVAPTGRLATTWGAVRDSL